MQNDGLILSSDPSKGAFEAGAWQAFHKMNLSLNCIAGSGLNVFNAVLMAQAEPDKLFNFWHEGIVNNIMTLNASMVRNYVNEWSYLPFEDFRTAFFKALNENNHPISELRIILEELIDETCIRQAHTQLLMILPNSETLDSELIDFKDLPSGQLIERLLLCAALPAFSTKEDFKGISDAQTALIDGMVKYQCTEVILFESPNPVCHRQFKQKGLNEKIIHPSIFQPPCTTFERSETEGQLKAGYLDTLKAFKLLSGKKYYFHPEQNSDLYLYFSHVLGAPHPDAAVNRKLASLMSMNGAFNREKGLEAIKILLRKSSFRKETVLPAAVLELTALKFQPERLQEYTWDTFIEIIIECFESTFSEHIHQISRMRLDHLLDRFGEATQSKALELPVFLSLYSWICNPDKPLSFETIQEIKENILPEDQLALLGLIYLNLAIQAY